MRKEKTKILEKILLLISSDALSKELYDKYLSDTEINSMDFESLKKYFEIDKEEPEPNTDRLTVKIKDYEKHLWNPKSTHGCKFGVDYTDIINKLGALEDIADDFGISFEILHDALENGFYFDYKNYSSISSNDYVITLTKNLRDNWVFNLIDSNNSSLFTAKLKDYQKTWWLEKDKSR